ncbi:hypothetical protein NHX12_006737 [Muraenolepis orangiensis]|uniref:V-SNARE coiled-coil homology domain-containing protein n=1 Tax=Muraenolepis orangiensis TaxID=630683 RepID=A0A9Q0DLM2_9TELE|nr:hypothetical protein NHX12_006737 [Muraenolepis orangiensis]
MLQQLHGVSMYSHDEHHTSANYCWSDRESRENSFSRSRSSSVSSIDRDTKEAVTTLQFGESFGRKSDAQPAPCLWVGTSLGVVLLLPLSLPTEEEERMEEPVTMGPGGSVLMLKGSVLRIAFLDLAGAIVLGPHEVWRDPNGPEDPDRLRRRKLINFSPASSQDGCADGHLTVVCSERQAKVLLMPSQSCLFVHNITESSFVLRADVVSVCNSVCLACFCANGHVMTLSLPSLRPLMDVNYLPLTDMRIARTFCFTNGGQALYLSSPTEEMLGELFTPIETPEVQNRSFLKVFFGGNSQNFDREELFGEAAAGKASRSLAQHIPGQVGMEGMKVAASGVVGDLARARIALDERGQRLGELEERTALMMNSADTFSKHAHELMLKCKDKKWAANTLVWGPGLEADVVLPARFFFIQAVDGSGRNLTTSPGEKTFEVKITSTTEQFARIWIQVLDRQDGSFLARYRMYSSYTDLHIHVLLEGENVAKSPFILPGPVYHEGCDCPQASGPVWESSMRCPASFPQIERDLAVYPRVDPERNAREILQRFGQRQSLCHYTVKDNKVYIKTMGEHVGFRIFMDALLLSLTRKVRVPDVEFFVNLGDWPLEKRQLSDRLHPIFSWCGSNQTWDIVMPTYDLTEVSLDMMSVQSNTGRPWADKNFTAFWRGRDSRKERLELVKLSRAHPDMVDAAFTNFFFFKHDEDLYGPLVKHVSFFDFFKYKYQINVDGTVAAYRLPYLLAGDSVVLKQDSGYYEHFYNELKPWTHYIPVRADLGDLLEKIQWARDNDEEARKIGVAGQQFARNQLMGESIFCYYYKLFEKYAELQVSEPTVRSGMTLVEQPNDDLFPCSCQRTTVKDEL